MSNKNRSAAEVPRHPQRVGEEGRDPQSTFYDAYFFGQLFALYQAGVFPRGNLDAGRLNALVELRVLEFADDNQNRTCASALYRLNVARGFELFGELSGSPAHGGFDG